MHAYLRLALCGFLVLAATGRVSADVFATATFQSITLNNDDDVATGETQLGVDIGNDIATGGLVQVRFTFFNLGPDASSITDVYFDDGNLFGIAALENTPGEVEFSEDATPGNLPGGENADPPFVATESFTVDSDPPVEPLGVGPGETLGIIFDLQSGATIPDVVDDLTTGALRIGIRVQGFASDGSESFINVPLPEPGSLLLGLAGLAFVLRSRRSA